MSQAFFSSPFLKRLEKIANQEPNCVRGTKINLSSSDLVYDFFQQRAHITDAFKAPMRNIGVAEPSTTVLSSSLSTELREFLWMGMEETQAAFDSRCLARMASLRASPTPGLPLFFCRFVSLKADGGTLRE